MSVCMHKHIANCPTRGLIVLWLRISWPSRQTVLVVLEWGSVIRWHVLSSPYFVTTAMNAVARPTRRCTVAIAAIFTLRKKKTFCWQLTRKKKSWLWPIKIVYARHLKQNVCADRNVVVTQPTSTITQNMALISKNFWSPEPLIDVSKAVKQSDLTKISPLKTKRRQLYLKTQSVPRCKHFSSRL